MNVMLILDVIVIGPALCLYECGMDVRCDVDVQCDRYLVSIVLI